MGGTLGGLTIEPRPTRLLIDANLLLLYAIGVFDVRLISEFKKTREYSSLDFEILQLFVGGFDRVVTTPNVLTEVSNHAEMVRGDARPGVFQVLSELIELMEELYIPSLGVAKEALFWNFGLADLGLLHAGRSGHFILTADGSLADYLGRSGVDVITYEQVKKMTW